jgi:transposase
MRIWLERKFVDRLLEFRLPGESYSDVISRLATPPADVPSDITSTMPSRQPLSPRCPWWWRWGSRAPQKSPAARGISTIGAPARGQISARVGRRGKGGQERQALGRSRGGFPTKIHAKADASGDIIAFDLTGGEASDARHFDVLLDIGPDIQPRAVICDKGYASKANREAARERGIAPVIPHKANERDKPAFFARTLYKARSRIEQGVGRLKRFKRVALRCEKTARNFRSIVSFAAGLCLIKFVHTA